MNRAIGQAGRQVLGCIGAYRPRRRLRLRLSLDGPGRSGIDGQLSSNKLSDSPAIEVGRPICPETARKVNALMVITGAPVGSVACSLNGSSPVRVKWTCSWVAAVANRVIPLNAYGSRSDAESASPVCAQDGGQRVQSGVQKGGVDTVAGDIGAGGQRHLGIDGLGSSRVGADTP